ncbi:MAG: hypothetical protein WA821_06030 [Anaerolineales bacterium]
MQNTDNSFAAKLNRLFAEKTKPDGTPYSKREVVKGVPALGPVELWRIEHGRLSRPRNEVVQGLAKFFGVPPSYFEDADAQASPKHLRLEAAFSDFEADAEERKAVIEMIQAMIEAKR